MMRWLLLLIAFPLLSHAAVERLVTLGGDVTEIVYALHVEESRWRGTAPAAGPGGAKVAGRRLPATAERRGILALRPQLVLASAAQPSLVLHKVQASGVKVVNVPGGESLSAIDNKVAVIAEALGKTAAGDALRQQLQQQIAAIPTQPVAKRVLFILSHGGMNTRWPDSIPRPMAPFAPPDCRTRCRASTTIAPCRRKGSPPAGGSGGDLRRWSQGMGGEAGL